VDQFIAGRELEKRPALYLFGATLWL